jgi:quercetin dioxygenase-like cupin family protein
MAESKYGKYIITRPKQMPIPEGTSEEDRKRMEEMSEYIKPSIYIDDEVCPGAYYLMGNWMFKPTGRGSPDKEHEHDFDEYLIFLGTNPDDVFDLGGEVELWLGGEKHILTETCAVFIPAGLKHTPVYFRRIDRPIWYGATGPTKSYKKDIIEEAK